MNYFCGFGLMKRSLLLLVLGVVQCDSLPDGIPDHEVAAQWADMTLHITKDTPANSPTFASRCLGYIGLTQYEAVVHGFPEYQSLVGQLSGLEELPLPEANARYSWPMVLNRAESEILASIYIQTSDQNKKKIDSLEKRIYAILKKSTDQATAERSNAFGTSLARAIFEWSTTDGGHRGYLNNFDTDFKKEPFPGSWKPPLFAQSFSHHPLHPYWGENRPFAPQNKNLPLPDFISYDPKEGSSYYDQFLKVYEKERQLTQEEKELAIWWSDDPDVTFSPGGHLYYLANAMVRKNQPTLIHSAQTFARVGMAVADAFINCWKWKYHFFSERPNTFIPQFIDQKWESFWPDPPFPAFPSGHAIQAGAAATVLISLYDNKTAIIDSAHVGRERDHVRNTEFVAQSFDSIWQIALETADSRFFGGIHTPQDNQVGLEQGSIIANNIVILAWKK